MRYVESLNAALHDLMGSDPSVVVLGEDILDPYGGAFKVTKGLSSAYPGRVLTTPISESAITGFASGMALRGLRPVMEIMFGDFLTLCADQIVNGACKFSWMYNGKVTVPLVIRTPMGGRRGYGPTHSQTLETLFLGVPGLRIVAPSHYHDPGALLRNVVTSSTGPVLFIESKTLYPQQLLTPDSGGKAGDFFVSAIRNQDPAFPSMSLRVSRDEQPQATLLAYGAMAPLAVEAAINVFMREELLVEVILPSSVKPLPLADILPAVQRSGAVVIAEEGVRTAGWGAELAAQIYESAYASLRAPVRRIGAHDCPIPSSKTLEDQVLPQVRDIEDALYSLVN
jgi:pyruvate/2-oxoglutarate/acetoin dehydrogenase E1 component